MRIYECTCRRKGTLILRARTNFEVMKRAAAEWDVDIATVVALPIDPRPPMYAVDKDLIVCTIG